MIQLRVILRWRNHQNMAERIGKVNTSISLIWWDFLRILLRPFHHFSSIPRLVKRFLSIVFGPLVRFFVRYPAVLSGYIIYLYFLFETLDFYRNVKEKAPHANSFQNFDALIWMWLLAWTLVKVIEYRTKLQDHLKRELENKQALELQKTQISTMHEVIRA